jgi:hypothetical protein
MGGGVRSSPTDKGCGANIPLCLANGGGGTQLDSFENGQQERHDFGRAAHAVEQGKEVLGPVVEETDRQLTDPLNYVGGVPFKEAKAGAALGGIVYRRVNPATGAKYIGKAMTAARYASRKGEHDLAQGVKHIYEIVEQGPVGRGLQYAEEKAIRAEGGLNALANKISAMSEEKFRAFEKTLGLE